MSANRSSEANNETNINERSEEDSSSGSSVDIRVLPGSSLTGNESSDSNATFGGSEKSCILEVRVETQLSRDYTQAKGVRIRVLQSDLHRVRVFTPEDIEQRQEGVNPNEDVIRVWSPENCIPWKFEIEVTERTRKRGRPESRPGSPQQEAGGPREASRRLNR